MVADVRVELPPGCYGIKTPDGREYNTAHPGTSVMMERHHADLIAGSSAGVNGILSAQTLTGLGTRAGRVCTNQDCPAGPNRIWNAWSKECPRCGAPTKEAH